MVMNGTVGSSNHPQRGCAQAASTPLETEAQYHPGASAWKCWTIKAAVWRAIAASRWS